MPVSFLIAEDDEIVGKILARALGEHGKRITAHVQQWTATYDLTTAEAAVLELAAQGAPRPLLPQLRDVAPSTVKKQVQFMLTKTGDSSLDIAVSRLLRAIVAAG